MTLFKFLFYFLMISSLAGCGCGDFLSLSENEKKWVSHFKIGQNQYYKNSKGEIDTLIVIDSTVEYSPCNTFELSEYQNESDLIKFKFKSSRIYNGIEPKLIITTVEREKRIPQIYLGNLGPHRSSLENELPNKIDTTLNNLKFSSVYLYTKNTNTEQYGQKEYFKSFIWSKELGLIAYTTIDNNHFILTH